MKLEDLTKEELISFIKTDYRLSRVSEREILKSCIWNRFGKLQKKQDNILSEIIELSEKYTSFLKQNKDLNKCPMETLKKAVGIEKRIQYLRQEDEKINKQINLLKKFLL